MRSLGRGPGPAFTLRIVDDADSALRLQRNRHIAKQRDGLLHFMERVDDEDRVQRAGGETRVGRCAPDGANVLQPFFLHATLMASIISRWMSSAYTDAVRPDAPGETDGEPAASGTEVGDDSAVGDAERIHDLIGFLPGVAIRCLEQAEVRRQEQTPVPRLRFGHQRHRGPRHHAKDNEDGRPGGPDRVP